MNADSGRFSAGQQAITRLWLALLLSLQLLPMLLAERQEAGHIFTPGGGGGFAPAEETPSTVFWSTTRAVDVPAQGAFWSCRQG